MNTNMKFKTIDNNIALYFSSYDKYFLLDNEMLVKVLNFNTKWYFDDSCIYPYYINTYANMDKIYLIEFLFGKKNNIKFINIHPDYNDLRENNIILETEKHKYNDIICKKYNVIEYIQGHIKQSKIVNPTWKIQENSMYYLMYCHKDYIIKLTELQYNELKKYESTLDYTLSWIYVFMRQPTIISSHNQKNIKLHHIINNFNYKSLIKIENIQDIQNTTIISNLSHYDIIVQNKYNVVKIIKGHIKNMGQDAGKEKNRMWEIEEFNKKYILMYCESDTFVKLCKESYTKILHFEKNNNSNKKMTWFKMENNYIACKLESKKQLYMHQVIMDYYGNGKGTGNKTDDMEHLSVDHIDQDPTNNMMSNLRLATRTDQEMNSKGIKPDTKRNRKHNAKPLPDGLTHDMMPKYVVYYSECYNKENNLFREFFKIEKHPKLDKIWTSSKSNKMTILEKLESAKSMINTLL